MKISRELKIGIMAILAIALFIWGFSFIKGENLFQKPRTFYAEYDNVQGLLTSGNVTVSGLKVGKIDKIYFHPTKVGSIIVKFSLDNDFQFSKKSIAQIYSPDFISGKSIKILPSSEGVNAISGDTLAATIENDLLGSIGSQLVPLEAKVSSFITNADTLLEGLNEVLDKDGKANLKQSLTKLNNILSTFGSASKSIDKMLADDGKINSILENANQASIKLVSLSDSLNNANLAATIKKLESTLNNFNGMLSDVENGKGTMGKLLKDDALYKNLEGATKEMEELLKEMKINPKRFVHFSLFGKKPKPYKDGEGDKTQE